jgi:tetratricopeptide (TPR) repeat protein
MTVRHPVLLAVVLLAAACRAPATAPVPAKSAVDVKELRARGDAHLSMKEYEAAVQAYRDALAVDSGDVGTRHRLAVALAGLGRSDEAAESFRWVLASAARDSEEARIARQWLGEGEGSRSAKTTMTPPQDDSEGTGRLEGQTQWAELDTAQVRPALQMLLQGDGPLTQGRRYFAKTRLGEPYRFEKVIPGQYRLSAQVGSVRLWDTTVAIGSTGPTSLDLTPKSAVAPPEALRPKP